MRAGRIRLKRFRFQTYPLGQSDYLFPLVKSSRLSRTLRPFIWRPGGFVPGLESLETGHGLLARQDVTAAIGPPDLARHPLTVVELAGGKIISNVRLAATADDVVIGGVQSLFGSADPQNHHLLHRRRLRFPKFRRGTALLLGGSNCDNYYHWLLDSLPRWKILSAAGYADYDYVLLHDRPAKFQEELLDRLRVPAAKRLRCSKNFVHQFERLVVPAMPAPLEAVPAWACAWLRSLFPEKSSGPEKIYLARPEMGRRRLVNQAELRTALEALGFVTLQPEHMSVAEQAGLLRSARCVVAPHGAALTNLIFAPPGALLLELFHPSHKNRCYVNLAAACGHRYASLDGQAILTDDDQRLEYKVDVSGVLETLSGTM